MGFTPLDQSLSLFCVSSLIMSYTPTEAGQYEQRKQTRTTEQAKTNLNTA